MTKAELKMLERLYAAEVERRLPFQSKSKLLERMEADGLVRRSEKRMPGKFEVIVRGWELTLAGNFTYCMTCNDEPSGDSQ